MSKWKLFHQKYAEPKISAGQAIAERLKTELSIHLTTKKTEQSKPENHPQTLLQEANGGLGKLSRIFEQMDWPMPDYEEISAQIGKVGIRAYTKSLLDDILPTLLDNKGSKLNQKVINAINFAGQGFKPPIKDLYGEYCKRNFEEEIANQFAQALIIGFTQKVLDAEKAKSIMLRETEIAKLTDKFESEVQTVLSASLPKAEEKETLSQLSQAYQQAIKEQENADRIRQTRLI
ncbi:hypothetical protein [Legionella sp. km772]|uniref:hypothetical protein n=1 Tax=Legionella sp. km772 TaxID=2498111 RepID=UPI000F8D7FE7|nr:hypothetical protein [Legionella sp. km772]RUR09520.1 hypothetical protein ELY15_09090 [Legionella sp. km772]